MDKNARIIVVDDNESAKDTMKAVLESKGYLVDYAVSGKEAIKKTQETTWALLYIRPSESSIKD